jgi:phosphohistidine phosphatase SixA
MRHAEKPDDKRDPDLSQVGHARAKALAKFIPEKLFAPDFIFASAISKHSARPYETVRPLSKVTGTPIDSTVADQDYRALADDLLSGSSYAGKVGVVCWHHGNIPLLMNELGAPRGQYPDPWDAKVFNLILRVDFDDSGAPQVSKVDEPF